MCTSEFSFALQSKGRYVAGRCEWVRAVVLGKPRSMRKLLSSGNDSRRIFPAAFPGIPLSLSLAACACGGSVSYMLCEHTGLPSLPQFISLVPFPRFFLDPRNRQNLI